MAFSVAGCFDDSPPPDGSGTGDGTGTTGTGGTSSSTSGPSSSSSATSTTATTTAGGAVPPKPIGVTVTAEAIKRMRIAWAPSPGAEGYELEWAMGTDGTPVWLPLASGVPQPPGDAVEYTATGAFLPAWAGAKIRIRACNADGCSDWSDPAGPSTVDPAVGYLKATQVQDGARFGAGVAASEDGTVVAGGAPQHDLVQQNLSDLGYVVAARYDEDAGQWDVASLPPPPAATDDTFLGANLALSADGNRLAASAKGLNAGIGGVVVYDWTGTDWTTPEILVPPPPPDNAANWTLTGERSIALSRDGTWVAAGSATVHRVAIWHEAAGTWSVHAWLAGDDYDPNAIRFGYGVALSADGSRLAVGAAGDPATSGVVLVFERQGNAWNQTAKLQPDETETDTGVLADGFGASLSFSADGTRLAIGVPYDDGSMGGVGAPSDQKSDTTARSGAVYLFDRNGDGTWSKLTYIKAETPRKDDWFGFSVSLSSDGKQLAVGARLEDGGGVGLDAAPDTDEPDAGAVYVYREFDAGWALLRYVKAYPVTDAGDRFGRRVALSGDGRTLVVGADFEDGTDQNPNSNAAADAGALYLY